MAFCPTCGTQIADGATCPKCAVGAVQGASAGAPAAAGLTDNVAGALAYVTIIPAIVFLVLEPFNRKRFVRFHAWQSILLWGVFFVLTIAALFLSNVAAAMVFLLFGILVSLAMSFLWIVLSLKAWQGERFELPLFGELAGRMK